MPTGRFEERYFVGDQPTAETETRLLSAATGHISAEDSASHPGTVSWYRRRASRVGLAALLVIAVVVALLLLNGGSTSPVKSATRAAPQVTPGQGLQIAGQGFTPLPPGISNSYFTFPGLVANPNDDAAAVSGGAFPFVYWLPATLSEPVTVPVEIPAFIAPTGTL